LELGVDTEQPIRIIQTTLAHPVVTEAAVSAVFVRTPNAYEIAQVLQELQILPRSTGTPNDVVDRARLPGVVASWIDKVAFDSVGAAANPLMGGADIGTYFTQLLYDSEWIVIEQSPPDLASLAELLKQGTGVALGAYTGLAVGSGPLLLLTVPLGIIIVATAAGIGSALEAGLRARLLALVAGHKKSRTPPRGHGRASSDTRANKSRGFEAS
jgi:hypothetical protein